MWLAELLNAQIADPAWSQARIGQEAGVSQAAVSKWVNAAGGIQIEQAIRLAPVLGQDVLEFVKNLWPELAHADPVPAELRELLARATPKQRRTIVTQAKLVLADPTPNVIHLPERVHDDTRGVDRDVPAAAKRKKPGPVGKGRKAPRPKPPVED
jgi:transcriptional regulator with XRE-family HTH domain